MVNKNEKIARKKHEKVVEDGLSWSDSFTVVDVGYGIQKIQTSFVIIGGTDAKDRSYTVVEKVMEPHREVRSAEMTSLEVQKCGGHHEDSRVVLHEKEEGQNLSWAEKMMCSEKEKNKDRFAGMESNQRFLVAIEVKPSDVEQDLIALWKKITRTVTKDGLKWSESCTLANVGFGIEKIQTTFIMRDTISPDSVIDIILDMQDEVQSAEMTSIKGL